MRNNEGNVMTTANAQLTRRFFEEVCNNRQLDTADQLFSATHTYHDPASPGVGKGPAGIKELIGIYHRGVADAHWDMRETIESGDTVITRWTGRGTHTGELLGISPTRKKVNVDGIWIHRIAGGKIVESWNCWDALGMLQQLGVVPQLGARAA
jgi:ketosteroid isomerase-like protein